MIAQLIRWSIANRFLVLIGAVILTAWGVVSLTRTPLDALPGLARGSSLGVEWLLPLRAEVRGVQLPRRSTLALHWSHHL